jgi:hypothetical protein
VAFHLRHQPDAFDIEVQSSHPGPCAPVPTPVAQQFEAKLLSSYSVVRGFPLKFSSLSR